MDRQIILVALAEPAVPDMRAIMAAIRSHHPGVPVDIPQTLSTADGGAGSPIIQCADEAIVIIAVPQPIPREAWELAARRAGAMWPDAEATFTRHRAHLIVSTMAATNDRLRAARSITAVVGGLLATLPASRAVLWDSMVAHPASRFLEMASSAFLPFPDFPFLLWVSLHPFLDPDHVGVISFGLSSFAGREIELESPCADPAEALGVAAGFAASVLEWGAPADGDTFEAGAGTRFVVRHAMSRRVAGLAVLQASSTAPA